LGKYLQVHGPVPVRMHWIQALRLAKGGREKKRTKVTYIFCGAKKKVATCSYFIFIFIFIFNRFF
jgi:hypothetical protein